MAPFPGGSPEPPTQEIPVVVPSAERTEVLPSFEVLPADDVAPPPRLGRLRAAALIVGVATAGVAAGAAFATDDQAPAAPPLTVPAPVAPPTTVVVTTTAPPPPTTAAPQPPPDDNRGRGKGHGKRDR